MYRRHFHIEPDLTRWRVAATRSSNTFTCARNVRLFRLVQPGVNKPPDLPESLKASTTSAYTS